MVNVGLVLLLFHLFFGDRDSLWIQAGLELAILAPPSLEYCNDKRAPLYSIPFYSFSNNTSYSTEHCTGDVYKPSYFGAFNQIILSMRDYETASPWENPGDYVSNSPSGNASPMSSDCFIHSKRGNLAWASVGSEVTGVFSQKAKKYTEEDIISSPILVTN